MTISQPRPADPIQAASRHDWTLDEILALLELPLVDLLWQAQAVHRTANPGYRVQLASLLSVKTGGCEEDCAYCPQSMHHSSDVSGRPELAVEPVLERARAAKARVLRHFTGPGAVKTIGSHGSARTLPGQCHAKNCERSRLISALSAPPSRTAPGAVAPGPLPLGTV